MNWLQFLLNFLKSIFTSKTKKKFSQNDVEELLTQIKKFNAWGQDKRLDEHIDRVYRAWLTVR